MKSRVRLRFAIAGFATIFTIFSGSAAIPAAADVITTATGSAGADAYVQQGAANTNFGSDPSLALENAASDLSGLNSKAYLRFDLSSISAPITSASMAFSVTANNGGGTPIDPAQQDFRFHVYGLNDGSVGGGGKLGEDWTEGAITWNNAPANVTSGTGAAGQAQTGPGTSNGGQAVLLGSFSLTTAPGTSVVAINGPRLVNFLNSDTNHKATLIVTRAGLYSQSGASDSNANSIFASKENGVQPAPTLYVNQNLSGPHTASMVSDTTWRVTSTLPPAGWESNPSFDDSNAAGWQDAVGNAGTNIWMTSLQSAISPPQIWTRRVFSIAGPVASASGAFSFDDDGQLYLNGHLLVNDTGGGATAFPLSFIDPSFFVVGENVIAMHGINTIAPENSVTADLRFTIVPEPASIAVCVLVAAATALPRRRMRYR